MKKALSLLLLFSFGSPGFAQDSTFIYNYKEFRSLVDSCQTFSFYIVPYQSSDLHVVSSSVTVSYLKNAYHFLRNKKLVRKNADFVIAILVDSLQLEYFTEERIGLSAMEDFYARKYCYRVAFNMVVENHQKVTYSFPLAMDVKLCSPTQMPQGGSLGMLLAQLDNVLLSYKNYYIDRVDW